MVNVLLPDFGSAIADISVRNTQFKMVQSVTIFIRLNIFAQVKSCIKVCFSLVFVF